MMCRAAHKRGYCASDVPEKVEKLLAKYGMSDAADFTAQELSEKIGCCHVLTVSCGDMLGWLKDGGAR